MEKNRFIVGDLVLLRGKVRKIIGTYKGDVMLDGSDKTVVKATVIEGIPLTPAILEKNGWKKHSKPYMKGDYQYKKKGFATLNVMKDGYSFHFGDKDVPIKYVSDLQHLLFGLGIKSDMEV